jgi:hypothetical protein
MFQTWKFVLISSIKGSYTFIGDLSESHLTNKYIKNLESFEKRYVYTKILNLTEYSAPICIKFLRYKSLIQSKSNQKYLNPFLFVNWQMRITIAIT